MDAGDTIDYKWPLKDFKDQHYKIKVHSVNGFYRKYAGHVNDPDLSVYLHYNAEKGKYDGKGGLLKLVLKDNAYGKANQKIILAKDEMEKTLLLNLKSSHDWYDFTLRAKQYPSFSQQFAGHVEHQRESFTDPLMGQQT